MKYYLIIMVMSSNPAYFQAGPFASALACEKAAGQATMIVPRDKWSRRRAEVLTVCVSAQLDVLVIPKKPN